VDQLPTYDSIGVAAPILLVVFRIFQGLALGGQWGGAMLIATENAPQNKRGLYGSFAQIGNPVGLSAANGLFLIVFSVLEPEQLEAWGWRIPFLLSFLLIGIAIYAQMRLEETSAFEHVKDTHTEVQLPIVTLLRTYPRQIALATGALICVSTVAYIMVAYILSYGGQVLGIATPTLLLLVTLTALTWSLSYHFRGSL
jgi:MHS family shikimate/dehydroshikimate transporter-like MFS transporter